MPNQGEKRAPMFCAGPDARPGAALGRGERRKGSGMPSKVIFERFLWFHHQVGRSRYPNAAALAERFEVYACGVELANGFGELTDAGEQRLRFAAEMDEKARLYGERYPLDEDFLAALAIMPDASGIALGFDRLVMLATGASRIDQVIWVPVAE
mgnify:CR=1 FL=1